MRAVAAKRKRCGGDGFDSAERVPLDAGHLHQAADRIAGHAEMMLERDLRRIFDLRVGGTERRGKSGRRHRRSRSDLALAADLRTRDGGVVLDDAADRSGDEKECANARAVRADAMLQVVADDCGDNAGRAVRRRGHHAPAGGVLLVDRHGVDREPVHDAMRLQAVRTMLGEELLVDLLRPPLHFEPARQFAGERQPAIHASVHRLPDAVEPGVEMDIRHARHLVGALQLRDGKPGRPAHPKHLRSGGEGIRHRRICRCGNRNPLPACRRQFVGPRDEAAADRVEDALHERRAVRIDGPEGHPVGVAGKRRAIVEEDVGHRIEADLRQADAGKRLRRRDAFEDCGNTVRVDRVRRLAGQRQRDGAVGAVSLPGEGERAVQAHRQSPRLSGKRAEVFVRKAPRRHHWPDGVRTRRPDADLEDVEDAEEHGPIQAPLNPKGRSPPFQPRQVGAHRRHTVMRQGK